MEGTKSLLFILFLSLFSRSAFSGWSVTELPGYSGTLPFNLETVYVSVGDVEFFYYFVESEGNPRSDPVLLYMNGGPGCSGLNGLFYQIGPLRFNITDYDGGLPTLIYEQSSWTKTSSIIFIDAPVGAGFSYATTASAYNSSDTLTTSQLHSFLLKWIEDHPAYQTNRLYIGSDSYAGVITPMLVRAIIQGEGTVSEFFRCNVTLEYTMDVNNVIDYHENLTSLGLQVLVISGDHDMVIPHNGIEEWIASFDLTIDTDWRPWFIDGQVAGYTRKYTNNGYRLTYVTIKGAGHSPMEFKRVWGHDMFQRWIHYYPL